jgi:hypothetical protein
MHPSQTKCTNVWSSKSVGSLLFALNTYSGLVSYEYAGQYADTHPPDCTTLQNKRPTKLKFFINITCKSEGLTVMVLRTEVFRDVTPCSS